MGAFTRVSFREAGQPARQDRTFYQTGVFRTNCVDSLDRTNVVQTQIATKVLETFLTARGLLGAYSADRRLDALPSISQGVRMLWADHGDAVSQFYAGTGALKASVERRVRDT